MQETIYFYRNIQTSDFVMAGTEKKIIPVWPKNEYSKSNYIYDESEKKWKAAENLPGESEDSVFVEFVEVPIRPKRPQFEGVDVLEDLSSGEMQDYLDWREKLKRFVFAQRNFCDNEGLSKNCAGAKILVDYKSLTLKVSFISFDRAKSKFHLLMKFRL